MFSLLLSVIVKVCHIKVEPTSVPLWTEEELESFVNLWLIILGAWIKTAMFLLYHSKGCNICEMVLHECYVNDLHTTICSGMLGHHNLGFARNETRMERERPGQTGIRPTLTYGTHGALPLANFDSDSPATSWHAGPMEYYPWRIPTQLRQG
jgi:hypothetical protein